MPVQPPAPTILLVEDEPAHAALVKRAFREAARTSAGLAVERWEVIVAPDGPSAIACLKQGGIAAIILDYSLPGQTGLELLPELRAASDAPVLILTGRGDEQVAVAVLKAGADDYVVKSTENYRSLPHRLARLMEERRGKERLAALHRLSAAVSQPLELDQVLDEIARGALEVLGSRAVSLLLADEQGDSLHGATVALSRGGALISALEQLIGVSVREVSISLQDTESLLVRTFLSKTPRYGLELSRYPPLTPASPPEPSARSAKPASGAPTGAERGPVRQKVFQALRRLLQLEAISVVPLVAGGKTVSVMALDTPPQERLTVLDRQAIETFANQAAVAIENARLFGEVQRLAITDSLTGLYNRRHFFELAEREFDRARRYARPLSAIMLDINDFKQVNDTYGHAVGDQVLRAVARRCWECLREIDVLGRYGGDEFVILLPENDLAGARDAARRLRQCVAESPIDTQRGSLTVTISTGVSVAAEGCLDLATLLDQADAAMYAAKRET